eukprot:5048502-Alexandrium_andersonii.AAC.1
MIGASDFAACDSALCSQGRAGARRREDALNRSAAHVCLPARFGNPPGGAGQAANLGVVLELAATRGLELAAPHPPLGQPPAQLCGALAAAGVRPALLDLALRDQLFQRLMLTHEEAPELEAPATTGQLRLRRAQLVAHRALHSSAQHATDLLRIEARNEGSASPAAPAPRR